MSSRSCRTLEDKCPGQIRSSSRLMIQRFVLSARPHTEPHCESRLTSRDFGKIGICPFFDIFDAQNLLALDGDRDRRSSRHGGRN